MQISTKCSNEKIKIYNFSDADQALLNNFQAGDLIFSSSSTFVSRIIQWSSKCPWNHVAMVVEYNGELYILEASPSSFITKTKGIRLYSLLELSRYVSNELDNEIKHGNGHGSFVFGCARLENPLPKKTNEKIIQIYENIKDFSYSYENTFSSWWDGFGTCINTFQLCGRKFSRKQEEDDNDNEGMKEGNHEEEEKNFFCSQLMVYIFRKTYMGNNFKTVDKEYTVGNLADITYLNKAMNSNYKYKKEMNKIIINALIY